MRARSANCMARAAISMSSFLARASDAMRGLRMAWVMVAMAAKSPSEAMAKPASMMSTPRSSKGMGHGELFLRGHAAAGGLLAVAQRGVEKVNVIRSHFLPVKAMSDGKPMFRA